MSNQSSAGQKAARAASAAVNIARGAAAGGVYGAAVEAAKSFLPELIRLFVILLCVVILVPMLVFTALPNILFGYSSSTDQEIIDFTASAQELDGIYQIWTVTSSLQFFAWWTAFFRASGPMESPCMMTMVWTRTWGT